MKQRKGTILFICLLICLMAFSAFFIWKNLHPTYYLSFATLETNDNDDDNSTLNVYYYNLEDDKAEKVFSTTYCSSYPAAVYDAKNQYVYYSDKCLENNVNNANDKVVRYDCKTKTSQVIIKDLNCINDIYIRNNGTLIIVAKKNTESTIRPYVYQLSDHTITPLDINGDMCFASNYDPYTDEFVFCGYSEKEYRDMLDLYNNTDFDDSNDFYEKQKDFNIENRIYTWKDQVNLFTSLKAGNIPVIVKNDDRVLYGKIDGFYSEQTQFNEYSDGKTKSIALDDSIIGLVSLKDDRLICISSNKGWEGLYHYNLSKKTFDKTYFFDSDEQIYSVRLIKN